MMGRLGVQWMRWMFCDSGLGLKDGLVISAKSLGGWNCNLYIWRRYQSCNAYIHERRLLISVP